MPAEVSPVTEEYLETIYRLQERGGTARTSAMVNMLRVAPGTVTNTIERLEQEDYVTHEPYKGVKLTRKGREIALGVVRRHRLSERLLTDLLHIDWDRVHEVACRLEHGMDEDVISSLEKVLKHPKTCPHGNPIPTKRGEIVEEQSHPLSKLSEEDQSVVAKITEEVPEMLRYLGSLGLKPGASVKILKKAPFDGPITLEVGSAVHAISHQTASIIQVKCPER